MTGLFSQDPLEDIVQIGKMQLGYTFWRIYRKRFYWATYLAEGAGSAIVLTGRGGDKAPVCRKCRDKIGRVDWSGFAYAGSPIIMW